jgi:pimeloyl-ACP methyl ester carboxylesterase
MELIVRGERAHAGTGGRPFDPTLPTVVFVHGAGMDGTVWQFQTRYFAHHGYSVLAVDLPGHGRSGGMPAGDIAGSAAWLGELLDAAEVTEANLVGHSMGGLIALRNAATQPDRVARLALLGVAERMPVNPDLLHAAERNDHLAYDLVASWSHARPAHSGGHPTPGLWMMGSTVRLLERNRPGVLHADLTACDVHGTAGLDAVEVRCPTLLLLGEADQMTRPQVAQPLAAALPDSRVVTLSGAGHMSLVERPNTVVDELARFLGGG